MDHNSILSSTLARLLTRHAMMRVRQRGIPFDTVVAALDYGAEERAPGGARRILFGRRHAARARRDGVRIEVSGLLVLIVTAAGMVTTVYWR